MCALSNFGRKSPAWSFPSSRNVLVGALSLFRKRAKADLPSVEWGNVRQPPPETWPVGEFARDE